MVEIAKPINNKLYIHEDIITDDGSGGTGKCAQCGELLDFGTKVFLLSNKKDSHMGYYNNRPHCSLSCVKKRAQRKNFVVYIKDTEIMLN